MLRPGKEAEKGSLTQNLGEKIHPNPRPTTNCNLFVSIKLLPQKEKCSVQSQYTTNISKGTADLRVECNHNKNWFKSYHKLIKVLLHIVNQSSASNIVPKLT